MTLRDKTALGMSLPHRSPDPLALTTIGAVARRAEELGFRDLWVTENTVDEGTCLDPVVALTFAALIRAYGHRTQVAYDGQAALLVAREFKPQTVFVDIGLPGMNG